MQTLGIKVTEAGAAPAGTPSRYIVTADRLWDGHAPSSYPGLAVVVQNGLIESVIDRSEASTDVPWVEFPGCSLLPGLIDAHVHLAGWMLPVFLAAGVTTVRDVGNDLGAVLSWRDLVRSDPVLGPDILCCGPLLDGKIVHWPLIGRGHDDAAAIGASVAELSEAGVNAIKLYAHLEEPQLRAAVDAAHDRGIKVLAHLGAVTVQQAAAAGVDEIEHFSGCQAAWELSSELQLAELAGTLRSGDMVMCPTIVVWDRLSRAFDPVFGRDRLLDWVPGEVQLIWQSNAYRYRGANARLELQASVVEMKRCLAYIHRGGVSTIAGSDSPFPYLLPGFSLHDELALMVDAGLEPIDALRAATSRSAAALGVAGKIGAIVAGARADLLAVRGDPLTDISSIANVEAVFKAGCSLDFGVLRQRSIWFHEREGMSPIETSLRAWANPPEPSTRIDRGENEHH